VTRYHPPAVRDTIHDLMVAKECLAAAATTSWASFLKCDFGSEHYSQLKVRAAASCPQPVCVRWACRWRAAARMRWGSARVC